MYACSLGKGGKLINVFVIYGYSGGGQHKGKAQKTNLLVDAIRQEIQAQPKGPTAIVGDINAKSCDIRNLQDLLDDHGWQDLGSQAHIWGQPNDVRTCMTPGALKGTRIDVVLVCPMLFPAVINFRVVHDDVCPTHSTLQFQVTASNLIYEVTEKKQPHDLSKLMEETFATLFGTTPVFTFDGDTAEEPKAREEFQASRKLWHTRHAFYFEAFHARLDAILAGKHRCFAQHLANGNTDAYLKHWSSAIEQATLEHCGITDFAAGTPYKGRGTNLIKTRKRQPAHKGSETTCKLHSDMPLSINRFLTQATRCHQIGDRINCISRGALTDEERLAMEEQVNFTLKHLLRDIIDIEITTIPQTVSQKEQAQPLTMPSDPEGLRATLEDTTKTPQAKVIALKLAAKFYKLQWTTRHDYAQRLQHKQMQEAQQQETSKANIFAAIRAPTAPPLQRIAEVIQGVKVVRIQPIEIDRVVRKAWHQIYKGNVTEATSLFRNFIHKYDHYILKQDPFPVHDIEGHELLDEILHAKHTSGGLDGWTPHELAIIPAKAAQLLADLLNAIENGASWPLPLRQARAAFLAKGTDVEDPLDYRVLSILSPIYRRWASLRLQHLKGWIQTWNLDEFYAGTGSNGAEDAWYQTGLQHEAARLKGQDITGGTADIWKCFDQVCREFVYLLLKIGGFPTRILQAYSSFHEGCVFYNSLAGSLGLPHSHPNGIPQGCPLSMTIVAFWLRPLVLLIKHHAGTPRLLADDVMISAQGEQHEDIFRKCYELTFDFMHDIGAKIAPTKCFTFSSNRTTRKRLRTHFWLSPSSQVAVVTNLRDLGAHLSLGSTLTGTTITKRLHKATAIVHKIARTSYNFCSKAMLIRQVALATGLYGAEAAPACDQALAGLRSAIASTIGPHSRLTNHSIKFSLNPFGTDLDPVVELLARRVAIIRRMIAKHPRTLSIIQDIHLHYGQLDFFGISKPGVQLHNLKSAPPPGAGTKQAWKHSTPARGPFGLLCLSLHEAASAIDNELNIHAHNEAAISITQIPAQYLRPAVRALGVRARNRYAATIRSNLNELTTLDIDTYHHATSHLDPPDKQWLAHHHCLGTWSDDKKQVVDPLHDGSCNYCGNATGDFIHLTWKCPFFKKERFHDDPGMAAIDIDLLPRHLLLGLPSEFGAINSFTVCDLRVSKDTHASQPTLPYDHPVGFNIGIHRRALALIEAHKEAWQSLTARQVLDRLRTEQAIQSLPIGSPCPEVAPDHPNVWTDGTKTMPTRPQWSLAAFGIWHPARAASDARPLEASIGSTVSNAFTANQLAIAGVLSGTRSSSTRAEIAAGLAAMIAPWPVHIGTDSQSFAAKLHNMLQSHRDTAAARHNRDTAAARQDRDTAADKGWSPGHARVGPQVMQGLVLCGPSGSLTNATTRAQDSPRHKLKPICLHKDGDLWQAIDTTIATKGHQAIKVSWFKGHAGFKHLLDGTATPSSLVHNHIADLVADLGNEQTWWHDGTLELSIYYEAKQRAYIVLLKRIHAMQLRILTIEKATREDRLQRAASRGRIDPSSKAQLKGLANRAFVAPPLEDGIEMHIQKPLFHNIDAEDITLQLHLFLFFKRSRWVPTTLGTNGSSWLEIFARFRAVGGLLTRNELEEDGLLHQLSFKQQLLRFTSNSRRFINMFTMPEHAELFKPARHKGHRLIGYGFQQHLSCISANLCLQPAAATIMHEQLLALSGHYKSWHHIAAAEGRLWITLGKVKMRGQPPWQAIGDPSILPVMVLNTIISQRVLSEEDYSDGMTAAPSTFLLHCPRCTGQAEFAHRYLTSNGKWSGLKCSVCHVTTRANQWACTCCIAWPTCNLHRSSGFACQRHKRRRHMHAQSSNYGQLGELAPPCKRPKIGPVPFVAVAVNEHSKARERLFFSPGPLLAAKLSKFT